VVDVDTILIVAMIVGGFALLIKGGDILVEGSVGLATMFRISPMLIGMTIVAFGTSLPELAVSGIAAWQGHPDLAFGNIVGSNLANILLIMGLTGVIAPVVTTRYVVRREMPALFTLSLLVLFLALLPNLEEPYDITRPDGGLLVLAFAVLMTLLVLKALRASRQVMGGAEGEDGEDGALEVDPDVKMVKDFEPHHSQRTYGLMIICGLLGVVIGGKLLVDGSVEVAKELGVSQAVIGLTLVAVGSSLPELVTSAMAAMKKQPGLVLGNIVGSNMFNIFILGLAALIHPISVEATLLPVVATMVGFTFLLYLFVYTKFKLERWEGGIFVISYLVYLGYVMTAA